MRILHTESSVNWGGQEHRTLEQMVWLRENGHETGLACRPGTDIERKARDLGLVTHAIPFSGQYSLAAIRAARRVVLDGHYQAVDCHGTRDAGTFIWCKDLARIIRSRHITQPLKAKWHRRMQWTHGCHGVIVTSHLVRDTFVSTCLVPRERVFVVG
ncbi:MAG: glycosyltransferase, partial [Rhodospirillales bacterium]